jgi:hypothetical protein
MHVAGLRLTANGKWMNVPFLIQSAPIMRSGGVALIVWMGENVGSVAPHN